MGCVNSTADILIDIKAVDAGALTVFADGKYIVPPGKSALIWMKAKFWSFSGDSFKIKDMSTGKDGNVLFEVAGQAFSFSEKRTLVDSKTQEPVFVMKEALMQLGDKQTVYSGDGQTELFKVASNFGNYQQSTSGLKNNQGKEITLEGKMTILSMKGHICLGDVKTGHPIAKVCSPVQIQNFIPEWSEGGYGWARDDYFIEIAPGVDMALIIAMVLAYEKMEQSYDDDGIAPDDE